MLCVAIVKIILVNDAGKVLLQQRSDDVPQPGKWSLFGGSVEAGETPEQALVREIKEELNYDLVTFEEFYRMTDVQGEERMWYLGKLNKDISELKLSEGKDFGLFMPREIKNLDLTADTKSIINKFLKHTKPV